MQNIKRNLVYLLIISTLAFVLALPTKAEAEPKYQVATNKSQVGSNLKPTPKVVCCAGPGYTLIFDLPATVKIVFTRAVRKWLFVSVLHGCKPCLLWVMVDMAAKAMPERVRPCVKLPIIGVICAPSLAVRGPFIHDVKTRLSEAYQAIGMSEVYYNDCLFSRRTGSRYFSHTTTGCRA